MVREKLKRLMGRPKSIALGLILGVLLHSSTAHRNDIFYPQTTADYAKVSVMILGDHSGGSGLIYRSTSKGSEILTNNHICDSIAQGGHVEREGIKYRISGYKRSAAHDLCLIKTPHDFRINVKLADEPPKMYSAATISGHPQLLPTIITRGHFSGFFEVAIEDDDGKVLYYESQVVSATIISGSSGSPVFNSHGELVNVVFAGPAKGGLGHAITVPYKYVRNFLTKEIVVSPWVGIGEEKKPRKIQKNRKAKKLIPIDPREPYRASPFPIARPRGAVVP